MLAMVVNDDAGCLTPHGALWFIASMLAPTEKVDASTKDHLIDAGKDAIEAADAGAVFADQINLKHHHNL